MDADFWQGRYHWLVNSKSWLWFPTPDTNLCAGTTTICDCIVSNIIDLNVEFMLYLLLTQSFISPLLLWLGDYPVDRLYTGHGWEKVRAWVVMHHRYVCGCHSWAVLANPARLMDTPYIKIPSLRTLHCMFPNLAHESPPTKWFPARQFCSSQFHAFLDHILLMCLSHLSSTVLCISIIWNLHTTILRSSLFFEKAFH